MIGALIVASAFCGTVAEADLAAIAADLRRQDAAWDDISADYVCEVLATTDGKTFRPHDRMTLRWVVTREGRERVERRSELKHADGPASPTEEIATFDGDLTMTWDSQKTGSGSVGHVNTPFMNNPYSPKIFGIYVAGLGLGQPIGVGQFLLMKEADAKVVRTEGRLLVVEGANPVAVGGRLTLWLDPDAGYRPAKVLSSDAKGKLSLYDEIAYRRVTGARGDFWFPTKGLWRGVDPVTRDWSNQVRYALLDLKVDRHPGPAEFKLAYPKGALLVNRDTNEGGYTSAPTTIDDAPAFVDKLMSLQEHDRLGAAAAAPASNPRSGVLWNLLVLNTAAIIVAALYYFYRNRKSIGHRS